MPDATINGFNHHWEDQGNGEPLIMLHSAASAGGQFRPHFAELAKTFRILVPDMRGMGGSAHIETIPPSAWTDDVVGLLDHLGIDSTHVFGTSLGARVALRFATDFPQRVRTLVLDNPIVANEAGGNEALNARLGNPDVMSEEQGRRYEGLHGSDWKNVVRNYFAMRNDPGLQEFYNLREAAKTVQVPTLITRGDSRTDVTHPLPHAVELAYSITGSRLWIKPAGGILATAEGYEAMRNLAKEATKAAVTV
jgi:pimeloyl-ACP methyl ester carboxylesterase